MDLYNQTISPFAKPEASAMSSATGGLESTRADKYSAFAIFNRESAWRLRSRFLCLSSPIDLARFLEERDLNSVLGQNNYHDFQIPKKKNGFRTISAPSKRLKTIQSRLAVALQCVYAFRIGFGGNAEFSLDPKAPKHPAHGFLPGHSILSNAKPHCNKRWVFNLDLQDFFPSINFGRVRGMFMASPFKFPAPLATVLAQVCCHSNRLPQGAPTSPVISNLICSRLDGQLLRFARDNRCIYTRFADDITFSTNLAEVPQKMVKVHPGLDGGPCEPGQELIKIIETNGFKINLSKCRLQGRRHRQEVTGLTVNSTWPNIPRRFISLTRAMLHIWEKCGLKEAAEHFTPTSKGENAQSMISVGKEPLEDKFRQMLRGRIEYVGMIRRFADKEKDLKLDKHRCKIYQQQLLKFKILNGEKVDTDIANINVGVTPWDFTYIQDLQLRQNLEIICCEMLNYQDLGTAYGKHYFSNAYKLLEAIWIYKHGLLSKAQLETYTEALIKIQQRYDSTFRYQSDRSKENSSLWVINMCMVSLHGWDFPVLGDLKVAEVKKFLNTIKHIRNMHFHAYTSKPPVKDKTKKEIDQFLALFENKTWLRLSFAPRMQSILRQFHDSEIQFPDRD